MKRSLALLTLVMGAMAHGGATEPTAKSGETQAAAACVECTSAAMPMNVSTIVNLKNMFDTTVAVDKCQDKKTCETMIAFTHDLTKDYPYCADYFIDANGKPGKLLRFVIDQIVDDVQKNATPGHSELSTSVYVQDYPDLDAACPGYKNMQGVQRVVFWGWLFEILGFLESSCDASKLNNAAEVPNPPATGLYQLEPTPSLRSWRGRHCGVSAEEIRKPQANTACAIDVMTGLLKRNKHVFGANDEKGRRVASSYWESLNPLPKKKENNQVDKKARMMPHNRMIRYLQRFPLCATEHAS